ERRSRKRSIVRERFGDRGKGARDGCASLFYFGERTRFYHWQTHKRDSAKTQRGRSQPRPYKRYCSRFAVRGLAREREVLRIAVARVARRRLSLATDLGSMS